ncbi:MAG: uncharacterized protein QG620_926 [Patescibacteria group bacterium]|nr:uncharacterized protein [Patescibacteria group bacterium]
MSLKQKIIDDLKAAMKAGDAAKRDTLRMLDSMAKNAEIEKKKREEGLADEEMIEVIARAIKQRRDSISQYEAGGRADLAEKEKEEIKILSVYLPEQMSEEAVRAEVKKIVSDLGLSTRAEIGRAMGEAMTRLKGKAEGGLVKKMMEEELK